LEESSLDGLFLPKSRKNFRLLKTAYHSFINQQFTWNNNKAAENISAIKRIPENHISI